MNEIKLINGDCIKEMQNIPDNSIDAVITDPPYGTTNCKWDSVITFTDMWNKILKTGHLNCKIMPMGQHEVISIFKVRGKVKYYPIMENGRPQHSEGVRKTTINSDVYGKQTNDYKEKNGNTLKYPSTLSIDIQKVHPSKCVHPTQKPVELLEYLVKTYTLENETILDFTMGSGTTGVACQNLNRKFIGIELDKNYFKVARDRIDNNINLFNN